MAKGRRMPAAATQKLLELRRKGELRGPRNPLEIHAADRLKLRGSVNAMCWQCFGGDGGENHVVLIRDCSATDCALYHVRPYQRKKPSE